MLSSLLKPYSLLAISLLLTSYPAFSDNQSSQQQASQHFHFSNSTTSDAVSINIIIDDGYFLNQNDLKFASNDVNIQLGTPSFQEAADTQNNYRKKADLTVPFTGNKQPFELLLTYVGCSDKGFCFPPETLIFNIQPPSTKASNDNALDSLQQLFNNFSSTSDELLEPDKAFSFSAEMTNSNTINLNWRIADGYYLYQDKVKTAVIQPNSVQLASINFPPGKAKHDETYGDTTVYYGDVSIQQPVIHQLNPGETLSVSVSFQGCADIGVCYPPMNKTVQLTIPDTASAVVPSKPIQPTLLTETDQTAESLFSQPFFWACLGLFGAGIALSFTPCVFPMIPILSGIIIGHGDTLTRRRAFFLSLSYVIAAAMTYAVFGVLAGLFGSNLQATFQNPWILSSFSLIFVLLALSMFGLYELQLPAFIQSKLASISQHQKHGSLVGSFIMGALSALIVGPCVAAPLAGILIYIGQTGDAILGGFALFSLGLGMGVPLIIIGMSAGEILPKAGNWMQPIKYFFGVMLIVVAIWLMERILPGAVSLALWATLLIVCAVYMKAIDTLPKSVSGWQKLTKGFGVLLLIYGILLAIGAATGGTNPLQPLGHISLSSGTQQTSGLRFQRVKNLQELNRSLDTAAMNQQTVMLDFYADWCASCKEMEHLTFTDTQVKQALKNTILIQADVTANNSEDRALLNRFNLIGPPAILFFKPTQQKQQMTGQVIGYLNADDFLQQINQAL